MATSNTFSRISWIASLAFTVAILVATPLRAQSPGIRVRFKDTALRSWKTVVDDSFQKAFASLKLQDYHHESALGLYETLKGIRVSNVGFLPASSALSITPSGLLWKSGELQVTVVAESAVKKYPLVGAYISAITLIHKASVALSAQLSQANGKPVLGAVTSNPSVDAGTLTSQGETISEELKGTYTNHVLEQLIKEIRDVVAASVSRDTSSELGKYETSHTIFTDYELNTQLLTAPRLLTSGNMEFDLRGSVKTAAGTAPAPLPLAGQEIPANCDAGIFISEETINSLTEAMMKHGKFDTMINDQLLLNNSGDPAFLSSTCPRNRNCLGDAFSQLSSYAEANGGGQIQISVKSRAAPKISLAENKINILADLNLFVNATSATNGNFDQISLRGTLEFFVSDIKTNHNQDIVASIGFLEATITQLGGLTKLNSDDLQQIWENTAIGMIDGVWADRLKSGTARETIISRLNMQQFVFEIKEDLLVIGGTTLVS